MRSCGRPISYHDARIAEHWVVADRIMAGLEGIPNVEMKRHVEDNGLSNGVLLTLDEAILGMSTTDLIAALKEGDPSIWTTEQDGGIRIAVAHLIDGEVDVVVERLRGILST